MSNQYGITIHRYANLPEKKYVERQGARNLANRKSVNFRNRFGTDTKRLVYGTGIKHYINSFRSRIELKNWQSLIRQFCESTKLVSCKEEKMQNISTH